MYRTKVRFLKDFLFFLLFVLPDSIVFVYAQKKMNTCDKNLQGIERVEI